MKLRNTRLMLVSSLILSTCLLFTVIILPQRLYAQSVQPLDEIIWPDSTNLGEAVWSPDGLQIAVAVNNNIYLYNQNLTQITILNGHTDVVTSLDWNATGTQLVSAGNDTTIRIWDMQQGPTFGDQTTILTGHTASILKVRWSPNNSMLASLALDTETTNQVEAGYTFYTAWIWNINTGLVMHQLPSAANSTAIDWSLDNKYVVTSGTTAQDGPIVSFWNVNTGIREYYAGNTEDLYADVAWNPVSGYLAMTSNSRFVSILDLNHSVQHPKMNISRYDFYSYTRIVELYSGVISWNTLGHLIGIGDYNGNIFIVDFATSQVITSILGAHQGRITSIGWNSSENIIFTASNEDKTLRIWDLNQTPDVSGTATSTPVNFPTATATSSPTVAPTSTPVSLGRIIFAGVSEPNATDFQLYTISADGTDLVNVSGNVSTYCEPAWSPYGAQIAYQSPCYFPQYGATQVSQIYVRQYDIGSDQFIGSPTPITSGQAPNYNPAFSSDGQSLIFTSKRNPYFDATPVGDPDIYIGRSDGSALDAPFQLVFNDADDFQADWSNDNRIVFVSNRTGKDRLFWTGSGGSFLNEIPVLYPNISSPTWSPNGNEVAFVAGIIEKKIYIVDLTTSAITAIATNNLNVEEIDWSPYTNQIVFTALKDGLNQLFLLDLGHGGVRQITTDSVHKLHPAWAPITTNVPIATSAPTTPTPTNTPVISNKFSFTQNYQIYTMNLDGSNITDISTRGTEFQGVWSPDGTKLAFVSRLEDNTFQVFVRDLATNVEIQITSGNSDNLGPAWSPNGKYISFVSNRDGNNEIYITKSDGSILNSPTRITLTSVNELSPDWSSNGRLIFEANSLLRWLNLFAPFDEGSISDYGCTNPVWSSDEQQIACLSGDSIALFSPSGLLNQYFNLGALFGVTDLTWSPDSSQLLGSTYGNLFVFDLSTFRVKILSAQSPDYIVDPEWLPGQNNIPLPTYASPAVVNKVAYEGYIATNSPLQILAMDLDGSNNVNVSDSVASAINPVWSHDGTKLAYTEALGTLFVKEASQLTGSATELVGSCVGDITWSPDDQEILYARDCVPNEGLYSISVNLQGATPNQVFISNNVVYQPSWSNNNLIAFIDFGDGFEDENREIYTLPLYGTVPKRLTNDQHADKLPVWSPDGSKLAYVSHRDSTDYIYLINADGSNSTLITGGTGSITGLSWAANGQHLLLSLNSELYTVDTFQPGEGISKLLNDSVARSNPDWRADYSLITPIPTSTASMTASATLTPTSTATPTDTPTATATSTSTVTNTPTVTSTPGASDLIFADGFESGNLSAWSSSVTDGGDLSVTGGAALFGDYGLQIVIDDNNAIYITDETPNSATRYRVRFYFDPNSITMTNGDLHYIFFGYKNTTDPVVRLAFRRSNNAYQISAEAAANNGTSWTNAGWITITDAPHALELDWQAATSGNSNGQLTLWIDGIQQANVTGIANDTRAIDRGRIGAITGIDTGTRGTYYIDAFESRATTYIGLIDTATPTPTSTPTATSTPAGTFTPTATPTPSETPSVLDLIFADGFESGNLSAWSSSVADWGDLSVTSGASLHGSYGLQAVINDNNAMYVTDETPDAATRYRARFYFDPNSITMDNGDLHYIFYGYAGITTGVVRLEFRYSAGAYQIRAAAINNGSTWTNTGWFSISDAPHAFEIDWQASTSGNSNGQLTLWIDGTQQANLTGLANDTRVIDRGRIGAITGIDSGTRGTYYFDSFESRTTNYIGLVSP